MFCCLLFAVYCLLDANDHRIGTDQVFDSGFAEAASRIRPLVTEPLPRIDIQPATGVFSPSQFNEEKLKHQRCKHRAMRLHVYVLLCRPSTERTPLCDLD
jgi:hypothetical protein